jgi:kanamycin kinase/aminoglycoside 3'-phosphotransferase-2
MDDASIIQYITEHLVLTHGDYCLPNVLLDSATLRISGFIDLSRAGLADRYQDKALATRSLAYNWGPGHEQALWKTCGLDKPDQEKLSFYLALDEFF